MERKAPSDRKPAARIPTPTAFGVRIPPPSAKAPTNHARESLPPIEIESIATWLKNVSGSVDELRAELNAERGRDLAWRANLEDRLVQHDERIEQHEQDLRAIREVIIEYREMRQDLREINKRLNETSREDVLTARELGSLKADVARAASASGAAAGVESGHDAGAKAGKKWGAISILLTFGALTIEKCGPSVQKWMTGPGVDVPVAPAKK